MSETVASLGKKVDRLLKAQEASDWVSEQDFVKRTGLDTVNKRYKYRQANPLAWKEGNGTYIYSVSMWLASFKSIKEIGNA